MTFRPRKLYLKEAHPHRLIGVNEQIDSITVRKILIDLARVVEHLAETHNANVVELTPLEAALAKLTDKDKQLLGLTVTAA